MTATKSQMGQSHMFLANNKKLPGHFGIVNSIAMSREGWFVTGASRHQGVEGNIRIWNSSGEQVGEIVTDLNSIFGLAVSPDVRFVAAGGGGAVFDLHWQYTGGVEVWSLETKRRVARFGEEEMFFVKSLAFSPDGKLLLTSSLPKPRSRTGQDYKCVRLWSTSDFRRKLAFAEQHEGDIAGACFAPNGQFVACTANPSSTGRRAPTGVLARLRREGFIPALLRNKKVQVRFHDVSSTTPLIRIWNVATGDEEPGLELSKGRVQGLTFSPDGRTLASSGSSLMTWDLKSRKVIAEFAQRTSSKCVAFSPTGRILASGSGYRSEPGSPFEDCGVRLWDSESGRLVAFLPHEKPVHSLAFSPDGQKMVAGGELGELLLWDIESFSC